MPTVNKIPTARETPDTGQGGSAVTGDTTTGHASTLSDAFDGSTVTKTCRWHTFQAAGGQITAITLKATHTSLGGLSGTGAHNSFKLEYTTDGGSNWTTAVSRTDYTASEGPTVFSAALSATQNISQVQVRDFIQAVTGSVGETADSTATISDIKLEVTTADSNVIVMA